MWYLEMLSEFQWLVKFGHKNDLDFDPKVANWKLQIRKVSVSGVYFLYTKKIIKTKSLFIELSTSLNETKEFGVNGFNTESI